MGCCQPGKVTLLPVLQGGSSCGFVVAVKTVVYKHVEPIMSDAQTETLVMARPCWNSSSWGAAARGGGPDLIRDSNHCLMRHVVVSLH